MAEKLPAQVDITEGDVKKVMLRFLKHHYRFRPRGSDTLISADMRGMGGIVADGYLAFPQDDGQLFLATFEATSADTGYEVTYSTKWYTVIWDSLTLSFVFMTFFRLWAHSQQWWTYNDLGGWLWWMLLLGAVGVCTLIIQYGIRPIRRYRYIHAIEQFKQYHADDQWIALSEDVFPSTEHVYFKELRRQCIRYGFGLVTVDRFLQPHLYITPSREDVFKKRRNIVQFISQQEWLKQFQNVEYISKLKGKAPRFLAQLLKRRRGVERKVRFEKLPYNNLVLILFCLFAMGGIFYKQWQARDIEFQEKEDYLEQLLIQMQNNDLEPMIYLVDSNAIWPFQKDMRPYLGGVWEEGAPKFNQVNEPEQEEDENADIVLHIGTNDFAIYDCSRFFNLEDTKYLIQEGVYPTLERSTRRMRDLVALGLKANTIWQGCFAGSDRGYIVFLEVLYNNPEEALFQANALKDTLDEKDLNLNLEIRFINPKAK